ncbi:unnamed protein product [Durusdinium trenchii]|uniref:Sugar phosphate transporter domain-containing protein n=1 Tax=Durusdinium trenchii TaxID=1381693 RepID=A0ABP0J246_9DINO
MFKTATLLYCWSSILQIRKQELETCQCILLAFMTACIVAFAEAQASGYDSNRSGMFAGLFLVLLKSLLSALAAVLTESRYKTRNVWEANTMLKTQSFLLALVIWALTSLLDKREALQVCPRFEGLPPSVETPCVDYRGWDRWTFAVLVAEVGNGWISVAILKNLSAIAKFVCKGLSAPSLYVSYCLMGRNQFKLALFLPILGLTVSIVFYAKETLKVIYQVYLPTWVPEYRPTFVPHGTSN